MRFVCGFVECVTGVDRWACSTDGGLGEAPRGNILIGLRMRHREDV